MSQIKMRLNCILLFAFVLLFSVIALIGCSPEETTSTQNGNTPAETTQVAEGAFVSDEQCLSCHGGSYEAVAQLTDDLGDWNPHDSIHGGYNSCINCHEEDRVLSRNYCAQCHTYNPDGEVLFLH